MADAPAEVACYALIVRVPPEDPFPEEHHGGDMLALVGTDSGRSGKGEPLLEPLVGFGDPIVAVVDTMPYTALQSMFDGRVEAAFRDNFGRLAELKAEWDPDNLFRNNQNVEPAG